MGKILFKAYAILQNRVGHFVRRAQLGKQNATSPNQFVCKPFKNATIAAALVAGASSSITWI